MLPGHRLSVKLQKNCANLVVIHDDVMKWGHFPRYWPFVREFTGPRWIPHTKAMQWRGVLIFSLIFVWINGWVNNRETGDLRRYRPLWRHRNDHPACWWLTTVWCHNICRQWRSLPERWDELILARGEMALDLKKIMKKTINIRRVPKICSTWHI